ncbi:gliding motility-associated ABC transporter permease subunit GldF [Myroides sp. LJL119]
MKAICLHEIRSFLSSVIGYLVIIVFLLINGILLWIMQGPYNILDNGFADLSSFFFLAPLVLIFLIPSVTMRSFSEEIKQGTMELLLTKPLRVWQIVLGKFFGVFALVILAILPSLAYVWILSDYTQSAEQLDFASLIGSYFGLFFLASSYTSMGLFASSLSESQIVSFILGVVICLFFWLGIEQIAQFFNSDLIAQLGVEYHFRSICRGVIDTRDIVYFISLTILFLALSVSRIKMLRK